MPQFLVAATLASPVSAQSMPTIDTEDAGLGSVRVGDGRFHPTATLDVRNGDFARGNYDDDGADLDRLPFHVQLGFGYELRRQEDGVADAHLVFSSSNGFHSPAADEQTSPRSWYESNNLVGVVVSPIEGLDAGLAYTIKTSPNDVSETTHEASSTFSYEADGGLGLLQPRFAATIRPKGGDGLYTQVGIEPEFDLASGEKSPTIGLPVELGVGWDDFFEPGTGDAVFGSAGLAYSRPFDLGETRWRFRAEALALVRDDTLRRLAPTSSDRRTVVPLATVSLTLAY